MNNTKFFGYDESFKILAKHFFEKFSKVITDYEIIKLPKKTDLLVVETESPIREHVKIFDYFKKFNVIEFKSPSETFRLAEDLPKIFIYLGGILLNEKAAGINNTTFTLVSSHKPEKFLRLYKDTVQKVKNGVYFIQGLIEIPVYVVVTNEVEGLLDGELALLKEFATGTERVKYISEILHKVLAGEKELAEYLHFSFSLYRDELKEIISREKINMTIVEKNLEAWNEELGLKKKYIDEGIEKGVKKGELRIIHHMDTAGYSITEISNATGYTEEQIQKFLQNSIEPPAK